MGGKPESWRNSNDYRRAFFNKHRGLGGHVWFCVYCGKPLLGKKNVQVDHILPPSVLAHKKYKKGKLVSNTSVGARAMNNEFNLVAACAKCNNRKSDKIGFITVRGIAGKVMGGFLGGLVGFSLYIITSPFKLLLSLITSIFKALPSKIILLGLLAAAAYVGGKYFGLF